MLTGPWHALSTAAVLLFAGPSILISAQVNQNAKPSASKAVATVSDFSTCPYRSINYITQTLAQQCLTSGWTSKSYAQNATNTDVSPSPTASSMLGDRSITSISSSTAEFVDSSSQNTAASPNSDAATTLQPASVSTLASASVNMETVATIKLEEDIETESPFDNANFLSFDDWKRQNLAKAGQSADNVGNRGRNGGSEQRRRPGSINNALDSLGEDTEIDIDFGGFVNPEGINAGMRLQDASVQPEVIPSGVGKHSEEAPEVTGAQRRGKDAGKTCKERSNYASFDCAATLMKSNPECKGSSAVLVENKDNYMLNICSVQNKFFIVELCDDILIDTVVLANFEFFSSMFRTFRVSVSDRYPVKLEKWRSLGTFEARNSREIQAFLIENPLVWARYIRVEFLTHFGNEYYCPVSLFRIHGTTMMEEFNHDVKGSRSDDDTEGEIEEEAAEESSRPTSAQSEAMVTTTSVSPSSVVTSETLKQSVASSDPIKTSDPVSFSLGYSPNVSSRNATVARSMLMFHDSRSSVCCAEDTPSPSVITLIGTPGRESQSTDSSEDVLDISRSASVSEVPRATATYPLNSIAPIQSSTTASNAASISQVVQNAIDGPSKAIIESSGNAGRATPSHTQPPSVSPTTQESFFKSVHKRLQFLEANSTLSLQYIEEQSRILRDAFSKVEKRQLAKTSSFLETLNTTVLTELREFRMQYDQIWQSTVLELSSQREQSQHEVLALSARLSLLADQIVFQQRIAIVQFLLILLCLGLVIFSRHGTYLELPPRFQNAFNKSSANLSRYTSMLESPPGSPPSTRPSTRNGLFRSWTHHRSPSEELNGNAGAKSPAIEYCPPTPESKRSSISHEGSPSRETSGSSSDNSPGAERVRQAESSPMIPVGKRKEQLEFT